MIEFSHLCQVPPDADDLHARIDGAGDWRPYRIDWPDGFPGELKLVFEAEAPSEQMVREIVSQAASAGSSVRATRASEDRLLSLAQASAELTRLEEAAARFPDEDFSDLISRGQARIYALRSQ